MTHIMCLQIMCCLLAALHAASMTLQAARGPRVAQAAACCRNVDSRLAVGVQIHMSSD
jgi:hypothetical protein